MKTTVGVLAVLLLVSTLAIGQQYQPLPFPQEANTALQNNAADESSASVNAEMPSSMAAEQWIAPSVEEQQSLGSPFPSVANPSRGSDTGDQMTPASEDQQSLGSPFPSAANPSSNE